jgi:hypothetical protein
MRRSVPDRDGISATRQERIEAPGEAEKKVKQASETGLPPIDSDADQADHDWLAAFRARGSCSLARSLFVSPTLG